MWSFDDFENGVSVINTVFYSLENSKQERIINAALKEFARSGYEKASTNEIIKEAGISKGSLFNYFNSKEELYLFLFDYVVKIIDIVYDQVNWKENDFFERIKQLGFAKFKIYGKFPQAFDFLNAAAHEDAAEVKAKINKIEKAVLDKGLDKVYQNIDWTKFREDIELKKMINIINWTMLSFSEEQRNNVNHFEDVTMDVLKEWDGYFDILKQCFYKQNC